MIMLALNLVVVLYFSTIAQSVVLLQMFTNQQKIDPANPFREKIVHFDLKGAPPTLKYYEELFPLLKQLKVDAVLMEYEDMFPYWNELSILRRTISYTTSELQTILRLASDNNLEVIPLVQTFGHMEFVLKHPKYEVYRENPGKPDTICPSDNGSWHIIMEMLRQVRHLHPNAKRLHIGADEAFSIAQDKRCQDRLKSIPGLSKELLKLDHISRVAKYARNELGFVEVLAWYDMFDRTDVALLKEYKMQDFILPVVWGYAIDVAKNGYFPDGMFGRFAQVFPKMLFASAFKGAIEKNTMFCNITRYLLNQQSYVNLYAKEKKNVDGSISGIILTGWQRVSHFLPLCEILPVSTPSLVVDLVYLNNIELSEQELIQKAMEILGCSAGGTFSLAQGNATDTNGMHVNGSKYEHISLQAMFMNCSFPGSKVYDEYERLHRNVTGEEILTTDLETMRRKISSFLQPYFYNETISELLEQQLTPKNIGLQ